MNEVSNPFQLQGYSGEAYFCDRKEELKFLKDAMANRRNVSIISLRRLGKTSLIKHLFNSQRKFKPIFIDIYRSTDQKEMIMRLIEECIRQIGKPTTSLLSKTSQFFRSLELSMSLDPVTGAPEISAGLRAGKEEGIALAELFKFLEGQGKQVVIAIDEFQQILDYPETNTEALLREHVQGLRNVNFIFSGSNKRMLQAIFSNNRRPFYQATEPLYLGKIDLEIYAEFIQSHFKSAKRKISMDTIRNGLTWCRVHTYHVQYLFNRLYSLGLSSYSEQDMHGVQISILKERSPEYITLLRLLSPQQSALIKAIAKEGIVSTPTAISFIIKHELSAVSTVRQSLNALLDKEIIHEEDQHYMVSDIFLSRWLASDY
jgi:hypothetical protein